MRGEGILCKKIKTYGNILRAYSVLKKLEGYPGFSLEKLCSDINWSYDEVRHFMTFCEKIEIGEINIDSLKDYQRKYEMMSDELLRYVNQSNM